MTKKKQAKKLARQKRLQKAKNVFKNNVSKFDKAAFNSATETASEIFSFHDAQAKKLKQIYVEKAFKDMNAA
jgi:hypothetical protein